MYDYNTVEAFEDGGVLALGVVAVVLVVYFAILALGIASYVMTSLSLHRIASRRRIANPWMAWLPIANYWIIGSIADDYDKQQGHNRKWRNVLLILSLIGVGGFILMYIAMIVMVFALMLMETNMEPTVGTILSIILPIYLLLIVAVIVLMALAYCTAVCMFKIFESTVPEKALKYFLIYLLVPLGGGICLMKCRDKGYSNPEPDFPYYYPPVAQVQPPVSQQEIPEAQAAEALEENKEDGE